MKMNGKVISGSSILTILGVVCFATVLVAAAILSGSIATTGKTVTPNSGAMTLSLIDSAETGHGAYWENASTITGGGQYYQGVLVSDSNPPVSSYRIAIKVTTGGQEGSGTIIDSIAWNFDGSFNTAEINFSYDADTNTWTSDELTPTESDDKLSVWFVAGLPDFSGEAVTLNFQVVTA